VFLYVFLLLYQATALLTSNALVNTFRGGEEWLDPSLYMRSVSQQRKIGTLFIPEIIVVVVIVYRN
jgi:hypothetical protein